jgi:acetyl esterase/lipase
LSGTTLQRESPGWRTFRSGETFGREVFYVHGGGLVFYSAEDFSSLMEHFAIAGDCEVTAFRYPKAPEHSPMEIVEALTKLVEQRLAELPARMRVVFAGDSIGGYIALYLALRKFSRRFSRLVLIYPVLDVYLQRESYVKYGRGYCLNAQMMSWFQSLWQRQSGEADDFSPFSLTVSDREALPPTVLVSAEADVLRDEAFDWCDYLRAGGSKIGHHHMANLAHDFCLYAGAIAEARTAVDLIACQFRL